MRARVEEARAAANAEAIHASCAMLARWLASRDRDLDEAVDLALAALRVAEDGELRREVASWLESLGEHARAAGLLKPIASMAEVDSAEAAYVLVRIGVLKARAGAAAGAAAALEAALTIDATDAVPAELLGTISGWEPTAVSSAASAEAYVEAARRRAEEGQDDAEVEDLWRAFAADPASPLATSALSEALLKRNRGASADEVWRAHTKVAQDGARQTHALRRLAASAAGDVSRALGAALDEGLDRCLDGEEGAALDALLLNVGMLEALAARLAARVERAEEPAVSALLLVELARLYAGPLADELRALAASVAALATDPTCEEASVMLRGVPGGVEGAVEASAGTSYRGVDDGSEDPSASAAAWVASALSHDVRGEAAVLERVASGASERVRAVLLAVAADRYLAVGDSRAARQAAERATQADPTSARALGSLADIVMGSHDRAAAAVLERALAIVGPRPSWCHALADALDALGEGQLAVAWTQRSVALKPGNLDSIQKLLDRLLRIDDAPRLCDALSWLLSQPLPFAWVGNAFTHALRELVRLDPDRAVVLARRALDVFGPKSAPLRQALLEVAAKASDNAFSAAVLERWISSGLEPADRRELFVQLAELRERLGDEEGEARVALRAVQEGVAGPDIERHLDRLADRPATPDAQLWRLRARVARLGAANDAWATAFAWRDLGAALWDLAEDRVGAVAAWARAARLVPSRGYATLTLDLVDFAGSEFAFGYLTQLVETEPDSAAAGDVAAEVARAAFSVGEARFAFDIAARGIARCPSCAEALAMAERAAEHTGDRDTLSSLYEIVATRAYGRFGRRAAHYRAARFFERRGENALALKHAAQAFYAVPSEGSSFHLLARAAERAGDPSHAVRTVERVAERSEASTARAAWLLRAASIAGAGEDGARRKVDVLLRAALAAPNVTTIALLRDAAGELLRFSPEERDGLEMRLSRAANKISERLAGPDGARVALSFALLFLDLFSDTEGAFGSVERAFDSDADVDEYDRLGGAVAALAAATNARERLSTMLARAEQPHANTGVALLRLFGGVAKALGDVPLHARAAVAAALRDPDDDAAVIEADAAVHTMPELAEPLSRVVSPTRRAQALLAAARHRVGEGAHGDAAPLLERAVELADGDFRREIERELRAAWEAAGRGNEIEARVQREAASDVASPSMRADRWSEIAERRESRGDKPGAVRALLEACKLDPAPLQRWSWLERVAEIAGDAGARVHALEEIAERVADDGRVAVFKRLARAHERRGDPEAATATWQKVLAMDPADEEADQAIESLIVARGQYGDLAGHLARRAERLAGQPGMREMLRAVRLRRAAILEQRLGRTREACDELTVLLEEWPDNPGALRYLADLLDRLSDHAKAADVWRRAAAVETDPLERDELVVRAGRASQLAGDAEGALEEAKQVLSRRPSNHSALALRVDVARSLGADQDLGDALDAIAAAEGVHDSTRADLLLEASQAAARAGDATRALERAQRAAQAGRDRATPQLLARGLEYRLRGAGTPEEAQRTVDELSSIREPLGRDDAALQTFLIAEALDVVRGGGAGLYKLELARFDVGDHPLIALGLAERFAAQGQHARAVETYAVALGGSLLELRKASAVAIAAADSAVKAGLAAAATNFLEFAAGFEEAAEAVAARRAQVSQGAPSEAAAAPPPPSHEATVAAPARGGDAPAQTPSEAPSVAAGPLADLESALRSARTPAERSSARLALGRRRLEQGDARGAEPLLWEALADGLAHAGDVLAPLLASSPDRARDLVRVRRQQVALEPGNIGRLESLRSAALADDDREYARAVEHVLRAFDPGAGPLPPPPLGSQPEQPGIFAFLARPSIDSAGEALALLWEGAMQLFARAAASYGITGMERVVPGASSTIARLCESAMRVLDAPRMPLFVVRSTGGTPGSHVALLTPPSVILAGDVREDTTDVRFALGRGMSAALPQNVLRLGLAPAEGQTLLAAMHAAFGQPEAGRQVESRAARLAESFWQIVPARTQRRLQEILGSTPLPDHEELVARAHQSGRRVGMFLAGDFAFATRALLSESTARVVEPPTLSSLRSLCEQVPQLADLLRLAVSPEYAAARWHGPAGSPPRSTVSSGRFSLF
jgi:tetratricopeptide (TPR) repeat protein